MFKIKRVVKSALAAETLALEQASETCFMMKLFLCELLDKEILNEILLAKYHNDNKWLIDSVFSKKE